MPRGVAGVVWVWCVKAFGFLGVLLLRQPASAKATAWHGLRRTRRGWGRDGLRRMMGRRPTKLAAGWWDMAGEALLEFFLVLGFVVLVLLVMLVGGYFEVCEVGEGCYELVHDLDFDCCGVGSPARFA